jgi:hypothetical protein
MQRSKSTPVNVTPNPSDPDLEPVLAWLSGRFETLRMDAEVAVDEYWRRLKADRVGRTAAERASLGLRLRPRENGAFGIEWYEMGVLGPSRKPIAKRYIAKGRSPHYPLRTLLKGQPDWLAPLVREIEHALGTIRREQALLADIREAVKAYAAGVRQPRVPESGRPDPP